MKFKYTILASSVCIFASANPGEPNAVEIKRIESRGKEIALYEQTAIRSTDLLMAMKPDTSMLGGWVAFSSDGKWWALYGRMSKEGEPEGFIVSYAFAALENELSSMRQIDLGKEKPSISPLDVMNLAKAASLAQKEPSPWKLPWNPSVFREKDGTITAYLLPGFQKVEDVSIGGDFRLSISQDGAKILKKEPLHKGLIPATPKGLPPGAKAISTMHTHVITDLPTETDVAFALLHPEFESHYVMSQKWKGSISKTGLITEMK